MDELPRIVYNSHKREKIVVDRQGAVKTIILELIEQPAITADQ